MTDEHGHPIGLRNARSLEMFRQLNETDNAGRIRTVQLVGPMLRNAPFGLLYAEVRFQASEFAQWLPASLFRPR